MSRFKCGITGWLIANGAWLTFVIAGALIVTAILIKERKTIIELINEGR